MAEIKQQDLQEIKNSATSGFQEIKPESGMTVPDAKSFWDHEFSEFKSPDTCVDREMIKSETGWSDSIVDSIHSMEEYRVYKDAGLVEAQIGDKPALIRGDIDLDQVDEKGRTNKERMERGLAPLDMDGNAIELHHMGQREDSPLAELTLEEHRGKSNDTILHDKSIDSEVHGEGNTWNSQRQQYWKDRAEYNATKGGLEI